MFYFYILRSQKDKNLYFGYTDDLRRRLKDHNISKVISTKKRKPFEIIYYEAYKSEKDARQRELQVKRRAKSFISLKRRLVNSLQN